jgi:hypothetical protein
METLASYPCIPGFQSSGLELPGCVWLAISRGSYHAAEIETGFGQQGTQEETFRANRAPGSGGREKDKHGGGEKERRGEGVGCDRAGDSVASEKSEERRQMKTMTGVRGRTSEKRRFDRPTGGSGSVLRCLSVGWIAASLRVCRRSELPTGMRCATEAVDSAPSGDERTRGNDDFGRRKDRRQTVQGPAGRDEAREMSVIKREWNVLQSTDCLHCSLSSFAEQGA